MSHAPTSIFESPGIAPEEVAARLLVTPSALDDLTLADAYKVVGYMRPKRIAAGTVLIQEGEVRKNDYMLLVLEGDIAVENELAGQQETMVVNIIGPGHLIGEMGVLDGAPRSATCTATTQIYAAVLSRTGLAPVAGDLQAHGRSAPGDHPQAAHVCSDEQSAAAGAAGGDEQPQLAGQTRLSGCAARPAEQHLLRVQALRACSLSTSRTPDSPTGLEGHKMLQFIGHAAASSVDNLQVNSIPGSGNPRRTRAAAVNILGILK